MRIAKCLRRQKVALTLFCLLTTRIPFASSESPHFCSLWYSHVDVHVCSSNKNRYWQFGLLGRNFGGRNDICRIANINCTLVLGGSLQLLDGERPESHRIYHTSKIPSPPRGLLDGRQYWRWYYHNSRHFDPSIHAHVGGHNDDISSQAALLFPDIRGSLTLTVSDGTILVCVSLVWEPLSHCILLFMRTVPIATSPCVCPVNGIVFLWALDTVGQRPIFEVDGFEVEAVVDIVEIVDA